MAVDDDAPYPNPLDATSGPTTQWTRNNVGEAFPGVVTPLHYDFVVRAGELGIRGAYAERGAINAEEAVESDVADERVMAAFKGRLAVNVDTMCAFGDRVSETAAAEIEFGLLGFVREGVTRHPSTERHALIAERDAEVRAGIDERAQGLYADVEEFWRAATAPEVLADVAGAPDRWRAAHARFLEGAIVMTHVTTFAGEAFVALLTACVTAGRPELLARLNGGYGDTHDDEMSAALWSLAHDGTSMDEFLHEYGYQGNRAADLYAMVWREDPDLLRPILATMASMPEADGPAATGAARVADRVAAEAELLDALTGADRDAAERVRSTSRARPPARSVATWQPPVSSARPTTCSTSWPTSSSPVVLPTCGRGSPTARSWRRGTRPSTSRCSSSATPPRCRSPMRCLPRSSPSRASA
jgi:hypothetical protein